MAGAPPPVSTTPLRAHPVAPSDIGFRHVAEDDLAMLHGWLQRPHVARWWGPAETVDELRADWVPAAPSTATPGDTQAFVALLADAPICIIQCYVAMGSGDGWWEDETDPGVRGIDQLLADGDRLSQGIGRAMVRAFVMRLFDDPAVTDPSSDSERAIW